MVFSAVQRLTRGVLTRECLGWSAVEVWATRHPGAHRVEVSISRRTRHPTEVAVVCLAWDGTQLAHRRWYTRRLGADLTERLDGGTRLFLDRSGGWDA